MGKWSQVRCNCPNRIPLPKNGWRNRPYYNSRSKLSCLAKEEIEAWKQNIEGRYECGHRDGILVQFCPSRIVELGFVLKKVFSDDLTFEIYPRVSDWRNYFSENLNEELHISPAEAELWLIEAIELEQAFLGQGNISYGKIQKTIAVLSQREAKSNRTLNQRLEPAKKTEFTRIVPFPKNLSDEPMSGDLSLIKQLTTVAQTKELCQAAIESGNPVEMLW